MDADFVHLHLHSDYSLLDSSCSLKKIKGKCNERNFPAVGLTDTGTIRGALKFYKSCIDDSEGEPVKPVIGSTIFLSEDEKMSGNPFNVYVKDQRGFENLKIISHISNVEGYRDGVPTIDYATLTKHSEGLIGISCDLNGSVQRLVRRNQMGDAFMEIERLKAIFGEDYYIEMENVGEVDQVKLNKNLMDAANKYDVELTVGNDVHFYDKTDFELYWTLLAINMRTNVKNSKRMPLVDVPYRNKYFKSQEEMKELFKDYPQKVLHNTVEIAEKCNLKLDFGGMKLPDFELPDGFESDWEYLRHKCYEGLRYRKLDSKPEYVERLEEELFDIRMIYEVKEYNFARYFLIVWDYVNYAHSIGCAVGVGRGSACGSMALYCLRITNLDPLKHGLYFWRFLTVDKGYTISDEDFFE